MPRQPAKKKKQAKKSGEKSGVALVPQPHGGAIRRGSQAGNTPGTGRPPSEVSARALGSFDQRIPVLEGIADNPEAADADRIKAVDKLGKYGFGEGISRADVRAALSDTVDAIRRAVDPDTADELLTTIKAFWKKL